jgi:hypothetical protein
VALLGIGDRDLENRADVVGDGQAAEDRGLLRQVADAEPGAAIHRQPGDVGAIDADAARVGRHEARDRVEAGGLARTVRAKQGHDLATAQRQRHVAQHRPLAVALAEIAHLEARAAIGHPQLG